MDDESERALILWMTFCPQSEYVSELPAEVRSNWCATRAHNNDAQHLKFASIFLDLSGVPQGRVPRGRSIEPQRRSHQVSERRALLLTSWPVAFFVPTATPTYRL